MCCKIPNQNMNKERRKLWEELLIIIENKCVESEEELVEFSDLFSTVEELGFDGFELFRFLEEMNKEHRKLTFYNAGLGMGD